MRITLTNDFHRTATTIDASRPITSRRIRNIRNRLCGAAGCCCGGDLGQRGQQSAAAAAYGDRVAEFVCCAV